MSSRTQLKQYFLTGSKPTQGQFAELIDSLFHAGEDVISIQLVQGLADVLGGKASAAQFNSVAQQISGFQSSVSTVQGLIGDLTTLSTTDKSTLVAALNEVVANAGSIKPQNVGAGLTIVNGKLTLDLATTQLVVPTISVLWTLYNNDGVTPYTVPTSAVKALVVDKGVKASMAAKYKYATPGNGQALPTGAASMTFSTALPAPDAFSSTLAVNNIAANRTDTITLLKPKSGLPVVNNAVTFPTGSDTAADSINISYQGRGCFLYSDKADLTAADVQAAYNAGLFQTVKGRTFTNVSPGVGKYFYYVYDSALSEYTAVLYNDSESYFTAFQFRPRVTVVNNAGINVELIVGRSNATNAFSNSKLAFS